MTIERRFRIALLASAIISLLAFGAAEQSAGLCLLAVVGAVAGWWVTEQKGAAGAWRGLPRWVSSVVLLVMLIVAVWRAMQGQREVVSAFTGFLASIIVVKLCERRELPDYAQILTMSLFMTVGATLNNNSLLIGVLLLAQVPVFVVAVMLFQLFSAGERVRAASWEGNTGARAPMEWMPVRAAFGRTALTTILAGVAIAVAVFVLVPRGIGLQEWGDFGRPKGKQTIGFTEEVEPGSGGVISESQVAVMQVRFEDGAGRGLGGIDKPYYMRGAVLDQYDPLQWKWTRELRARPDGYQSRPAGTEQALRLTDTPPAGPMVVQIVTELSGVQGDTPMFALYKPISMMIRRADQPQDVRFDPKLGWIARTGDGSRLTYQVTSIVDPAREAAPDRSRVASFPSERIHELAARLLKQSGYEPDPLKRAAEENGRASRVFETYLQSNYAYTLTPGPVPAGTSPTDYFLFTSKKGHCEYFASALAAMCRSVGIDARVVAGYLVNEYRPDRGDYTVRASDAHAWVEVDTGPGGWQRRDATPADGLLSAQSSQRTFSARLQRIAAAVQDAWNATVVTFDQSSQERLLGQAGEGPQRNIMDLGSRALHRLASKLRRLLGASGDVGAGMMLLGAAFLGAGMCWVAWRAARRRAAHPVAGAGWAMMGAERRAYRELLAVLAGRGYPKPPWLPPLRHLREVGLRDSKFADAAGEVVALLYRSRFGGGGGTDLAAARGRLKGLRAGANGKG